MPKGHHELSLAGVKYLPDEEGAFNVPDGHGAELISVHGAVLEKSSQDLEADAVAAELVAKQAQQRADAAADDAEAARAKAEKAKAKKKPDPADPSGQGKTP